MKPNPNTSSILTSASRAASSLSSAVNASSSPSPSSSSSSSSKSGIPTRTLIIICVVAFVVVAALVIILIWFGARARKQKGGGAGGDDATLDVSGEDTHHKGIYPSTSSHAGAGHGGGATGLGGGFMGVGMNGGVKNGGSGANGTVVPIPLKGLGVDSSEQSSYYSQSTGRKPIQPGSGYEHARRPTADSYDSRSNFDSPKRTTGNSSAYPDDASDFAPPRSAGAGSVNNGQAAPRSTSAQAITRPYVVGAHPYHRTSNAQSSTENLGYTSTNNNYVPYSNTSVTSNAPYVIPTYSGTPYNIDAHASNHGHGPNTPSSANFVGAGSRPGYEAYGIESRQQQFTSPNPESRQPITSINARPSLESIRSIARKASLDQQAASSSSAAAAATEFVMGGPQAVAGAGASGYYGHTSTYSQSSIKSGKESKSGRGDKEKLSKEERKREMAAMDNLIAALDQSAEMDRKRKRELAAAAGLAETNTSSKANQNQTRPSSRRKDVAVTGSYPLPPPEVFRAALAGGSRNVDEVDDEEIERWRRRA
ncbi:hypothetical protein CPB86DRAFT_771519 [Serendipita vermifera]|nr:hypothetical protein CPB86DRAFT_771519 [Serendipita vermifera]